MREFVMSLSRLYANGEVTKEKIEELFGCGKITREEQFFILNAR